MTAEPSVRPPTRCSISIDSWAMILRTLRSARPFSEWPEKSLDRLAHIARLQHYDRRTRVLAGEAQRREVLVVVSGSVEVCRTSVNGGKFVVALMRAGDTTGLVRLLPELRSPYDFVVHQDAYLVHIPSDPLTKLMDAEPILWRSIAMFSLRRQRDNITSMQHRALSALPETFASLLVKLSAGMPDKPVLELSQNELGSMLGVSRQTVNKEIGKLAAKGIVALDYGRIEILDVPALREAAERQTSR